MIRSVSESLAQKTQPWAASTTDQEVSVAKTLPFTITFQGVRLEHGVAYLLSNNLTAVDGIEVQQTPLVYKHLQVHCHSGLLGSLYSPARIMCTKTAMKMAQLKKDWIETKLSEKVRDILQVEFDNKLPGRLPKERYDRMSHLASTLVYVGVLLICCGCCLVTLRHHSNARSVDAKPLIENQDNAHFENGAE